MNILIGDDSPHKVFSIVEIPKGTKNKYEYDERLGAIRLDRVVHSSVVYPVNYGFIPQTYAEDGDHLDVLIFCTDQIFPGCVVEIRPVGILKMTDDKGKDWKVVGVISSDPTSDSKKDITDIDGALKDEIVHFFQVYKQLEKKSVQIDGWGDKAEAYAAITTAHSAYLQKQS